MLVVHADSRQARQDVVGRAADINTPVAAHRCCSRRYNVWILVGRIDRLAPFDHQGAAVLAWAVRGTFRGFRHRASVVIW